MDGAEEVDGKKKKNFFLFFLFFFFFVLLFLSIKITLSTGMNM